MVFIIFCLNSANFCNRLEVSERRSSSAVWYGTLGSLKSTTNGLLMSSEMSKKAITFLNFFVFQSAYVICDKNMTCFVGFYCRPD